MGGIENDLKALDIFEAEKGNVHIQRKTIEDLFCSQWIDRSRKSGLQSLMLSQSFRSGGRLTARKLEE